MSAERIAWIDAVRTCACALVVLVHVNFYTRPPMGAWWPGGFYGAPFFSLAVPLFLIVSGLFADRFVTAARRRILRLVVPFLVWNAITAAALQTAGYGYSSLELISDLLTGTWHLYYVFAILQLLTVHFLIVRFIPRDRHAIFFIFLALSTVVLYAACDILLWRSGGQVAGLEGLAEKFLFCWALYFYAGVWMSRRPAGAGIGRWPSALLTVVAVASYIAYTKELRAEDTAFGSTLLKQILATGLLFQFAGALALIALLQALARSDIGGRVIAILAMPGRDTFGIYLCHAAVLMGVFEVMVRAGLASGGRYEAPILWAVVWIIAHAAVAASRRFAPSGIDALLFGGRRGLRP